MSAFGPGAHHDGVQVSLTIRRFIARVGWVMSQARPTRTPRRNLQRVETSIYVLAVVVGVVGTVSLVTSVVQVHDSPMRELLVASGGVWLVAWVVLLMRDRDGRRLLAAHDATQRLLQSLSEARRAVLRNDDPRQALVDGVVDVTGAALAMVSEVRGGELVVTASAGARAVGFSMALDQPSVARQVLESGQPRQIADIHRADTVPEVVDALEELLGAQVHSIAYVPIRVSGHVVGLITASFAGLSVGLTDQALPILTTLGEEAALSIERERLLTQLDRLSVQDPLTGLCNRRGWDRALEHLGRSSAVAMLDIDHFKRFNDAYGHPAGDQLLQQFSGLLASLCRGSDTVARVGGEEFAIVSPDAGGLMPLMSRARAAWADTGSRVTFSVGIACRRPGESTADVHDRADAALYAAKRAGRDCTIEADERPGPPAELSGRERLPG